MNSAVVISTSPSFTHQRNKLFPPQAHNGHRLDCFFIPNTVLLIAFALDDRATPKRHASISVSCPHSFFSADSHNVRTLPFYADILRADPRVTQRSIASEPSRCSQRAPWDGSHHDHRPCWTRARAGTDIYGPGDCEVHCCVVVRRGGEPQDELVPHHELCRRGKGAGASFGSDEGVRHVLFCGFFCFSFLVMHKKRG